jgi:predicted O-methyltransferase YrrM
LTQTFVALGAIASLGALAGIAYLGIGVRNRMRHLVQMLTKNQRAFRVLKNELQIVKRDSERDYSRMRTDIGVLRKELSASRRQVGRLRGSLRRREAQSEQALAIQLLAPLKVPFPISYGGWAIDATSACELVRLIETRRPKVILELGGGTSSIIIASAVAQLRLNETRHIIVDHLPEFLERTRRLVELSNSVNSVEYWNCPLDCDNPQGTPWYSQIANRLANTQIDFLFVDGPPAVQLAEARRPAMLVLESFLSSDAVVILDDANREGEANIVNEWLARDSSLVLERSKKGKGMAVLRREPRWP